MVGVWKAWSSMNDEPIQEAKLTGARRVRMPAEKREAMLDAFERSGMSAARFAAKAGVKNQPFGKWVRLHRRGISPGVAITRRRIRRFAVH
jgi:transposase-like protein